MLSVDGDANVTARICSGWFKFRSLDSFPTAKDVSLLLLLLQGKVYDACVWSCLLHGSEKCEIKEKMNWHCIGQK